MAPQPAIFFLSDYGTDDEFVGVVHAIVHRLAPSTPVIDLSHGVSPFDIAAGGAMLARSVPYLGSGVVLAVVDPGVGSTRRGVAVRTDGDGPHWLVGPDNGLLALASAVLGGPTAAFTLDATRLSRPWGPPGGTGPTFDGRDVFAPAACYLVAGGDPLAIGTAADLQSLVTVAPGGGASTRGLTAGPGTVTAAVSWIDRYGNVQLDLRPVDLEGIGPRDGGPLQAVVGSDPEATEVPVRQVRSFSELGPGELGLLLDGNGQLALVLDRASAAARLSGVSAGAVVRITSSGRRR